MEELSWWYTKHYNDDFWIKKHLINGHVVSSSLRLK